MVVSYHPGMIAACVATAGACVAVQHVVKKNLDARQYNYFRDLLLAGCWVLLAIWQGSPLARFVVGAAFLAALIGLGESLYPRRLWRLGYILIGFACALWGPSILYINFVDGEYIYFTPIVSVVLTTLWFSLFPLILQQLDCIPGMVGHVLAVTFSLMLISVVLALQGMQDAFFMAFTGVALLGAFWSRLGHVYRQAGKAMSAMWGVLVAGISIIGVSKGIVFSSMLFLSLGLFAIPLTEASLHLASLALTDNSHGTELLYRRLIRRNFDHPDAVRLIACFCAFLGLSAALSQYPSNFSWIWWGATALVAALLMLSLLLKNKAKSPIAYSKPRLWGIEIDNVSMNYALVRARGMLLSPQKMNLVSTVNALAMDEAISNPEYHSILRRSAMVLADGVGLLWGLRFLGMPIQERVTGIDFAEQLCRMAAAEGWGVYFLGSKGDTAYRCATEMKHRYPGLIIAGARDGYFKLDNPTIAEEVRLSGARILFVAMGIPRQEKWLDLHRGALENILAVGVGGAFDVLSGQLRRAPQFLQKIGLEWLFRLCQEPFRWKKDLHLILFVLRIVATRMGFYSWKGESAR